MKLSIIVPVFNEEKTVAEILKRIYQVKLPNDLEKEVVLINDGSTDNTVKILKKQRYKNLSVIKHNTNFGKGAAIRSGLKHISGDVVIIQDADLEYNPNDFSKLLKPILFKKADVVYGSRLINYPLILFGKNKIPLPAHWIGNKILTFMINCLYQCNLTDMETCYKLFTAGVLKNLNLKSNRFEIEPEITSKILKMGFNIVEIPIKVKPRTHKDGKKISWKDGFIAIWTILYYRFFD